MTLITLPLDPLLARRNPYFIFGRHEAEAEMRAAVAQGYAMTHGRYDTTHKGGMVRYAEISENLARACERYGVRTKFTGGQWRLVWPGLDNEAAEIIVLRGAMNAEGFDTSVRGIRSEEHSQLEGTSFPTPTGEGMTTGAYLFHCDGEEPGTCEAWFAPSGTTRKGWKIVQCAEAIPLGPIRYLGRDGGDLEPVDIRP